MQAVSEPAPGQFARECTLSHCVLRSAPACGSQSRPLRLHNAQGTMLAVGHANGDVTLWQLQRTAWEPARFIRSAPCPKHVAQCHRLFAAGRLMAT